MARGPSGRLVLEISPEVKRRLHSRLAGEGRSLKEWFLEQAQEYLDGPEPLQLPFEMPSNANRARRTRGS